MVDISNRNACIYSTEEKFICNAFASRIGETSALLSFEEEVADILLSEVLVSFFDNRKGIVTYLCRLSNYKEYTVGPDTKHSEVVCHFDEIVTVVQRRRDFKIPVTMSTTITFKNEENKEVQTNATILDLSAGGIFMACEEKLEVDQFFQVILNIRTRSMLLSGRILRVASDSPMLKSLPNRANLTGYGCCFVDIAAYEEAAIRSYVFHLDSLHQKR